jgi:hypothetical protein
MRKPIGYTADDYARCLCESSECKHHGESCIAYTIRRTKQLGPVCFDCLWNYKDAGYPLTVTVDDPDPEYYVNLCLELERRRTYLSFYNLVWPEYLTRTLDIIYGLNLHIPQDDPDPDYDCLYGFILESMRAELRWFSLWGEGTKEEFAWCFDLEERLEMLEALGF